MAYTDQQRALDGIKSRFGKSGFTEDHVNYRRVGCRIGLRKIWADGSTWEAATNRLIVKAEYPDAHEIHFTGGYVVVDGIGPATSSRSWLSEPCRILEEAYQQAANRLGGGRRI